MKEQRAGFFFPWEDKARSLHLPSQVVSYSRFLSLKREEWGKTAQNTQADDSGKEAGVKF